MTFHVITLFPSLFSPFFSESLIGNAVAKQIIAKNIIDLRNFGLGKHRKVDDTPYGGGSGMIIRPEPVAHAIESVSDTALCKKILLAAAGAPFTQAKAAELAQRRTDIMLICGRYEGFDARISGLVDETIRVGDFVCMGGEAAAMAIIESITRLLPGVLGNQESTVEESFSDAYPVEYDQYTKPAVFRNQAVPDVLLSGNHQKIEMWRRDNADKKQKAGKA